LDSVYKLFGGLFSNFFGFDHRFNFLDILGPIFGGPFISLVFDFLNCFNVFGICIPTCGGICFLSLLDLTPG
jgi:hypothetical protein